MRNLLMAVMMLIVVALMFTAVVTDDTTGIKKQIEDKGNAARTGIAELDAN